mmetsp:Transcript_40933/g.108455  ORF Transcript_40933/g.108455 Transcript_40933/m.108455 type:complete len:204 (-) Transcript_40933:1604-2215(-)
MTERERRAIHGDLKRCCAFTFHFLGDLVRFVYLLLQLFQLLQEAFQHEIIFFVIHPIVTKLPIEFHGRTDTVRDGCAVLSQDVGHALDVLFKLVLHREQLPCSRFWKVCGCGSDAEPNLLRPKNEPIAMFQLHFTLYQTRIQSYFDVCRVRKLSLRFVQLRPLLSVIPNDLRRIGHSHEFRQHQSGASTHAHPFTALFYFLHS